jgi:hypothetical protein
VRRRIRPGPKRENNERREHQHGRHGNDVEELRIPTRWPGFPDELVVGRQNTHNNHGTRE